MARSPTVALASLPLRCFQPGNASGSMVISAAMNGLASPTAIAWLINGCARSRSSRSAGATFLPPAVTMISFLRPMIVRKPSSSIAPRSPVWNQPSVKTALVSCFVVPVAAEHHAALDEQFVVVGEAHAVAGQQLSDRADLDVVDLVHGDRRAGLGQPVALVDGQADAAVEVAEPGAQRCAAGDRAAAVAAERGAQLAVDQPVEQRVLGPQQQARRRRESCAWLYSIAVLTAALEDAALAVVAGVLFGGVVHLLEHPRHRHHQRRLEHPERRHQVLDVTGEAERDLVGEAAPP